MSNVSVPPVKKVQKSKTSKPNIEMINKLDREKMISDAAYFRAENRSFEAGDSMNDWLVSEAEIDDVLKNH